MRGFSTHSSSQYCWSISTSAEQFPEWEVFYALSLSVKPVTRPARPAHICSICNKQFKNSYNLRRHQSVHTGVKMKDRAAREKVDAGKAGQRVERQTIPLSLLQLSIPTPITVATDPMIHPTPISNQQVETVAVSITPATVAMTAAQPLPAAVVVTGTMVQVGLVCVFLVIILPIYTAAPSSASSLF